MSEGFFVKAYQRIAGSLGLLPPQRVLWLDPAYFILTDAPTTVTQGSGANRGAATGRTEATLNTSELFEVAVGDGLEVNAGKIRVKLDGATLARSAAGMKVLAIDDTIHGSRAGGSLHADVIAGGASGFMTGAQATKLAGITASAGIVAIGVTAPVTTTGTSSPTIGINAADGSNRGSMSTTHFTLVNNATSAATATTLAKRGGSAEVAFGVVTCTGLKVDNGDSEFLGPRHDDPQTIASATTITLHGDSGAVCSNHIEVGPLAHNVTFLEPSGFKAGSELIVIVYQGGELHTITWTSSVFSFCTGVTATALAITSGDGDLYKLTRTSAGTWVIWDHKKFTPAS